MTLFKRPSKLYPTVVRGVIHGPIRLENLKGESRYLKSAIHYLDNVEPYFLDGALWAVTHLQYKAKYFHLVMNPWIIHHGSFSKLQEPGKPGTEWGWYWRTWGWRWQKPDDNSQGTPWIWTKGYFGRHLD